MCESFRGKITFVRSLCPSVRLCDNSWPEKPIETWRTSHCAQGQICLKFEVKNSRLQVTGQNTLNDKEVLWGIKFTDFLKAYGISVGHFDLKRCSAHSAQFCVQLPAALGFTLRLCAFVMVPVFVLVHVDPPCVDW